MAREDSSWTIDGLGRAVAAALSEAYPGQESGRIREVPDLRTIRYYTTLGLLDRPALQGRKALYGQRHLYQLVAIKRLQAEGLTLAQVQARLAGQTTRRLAALAAIERPLSALVPPEVSPLRDEPSAERAENFWRRPARSRAPVRDHALPAAAPAPVELAVPLDPDVRLFFAAARALNSEDLEAIHAVASPLLRLLEERGLRASPNRKTRDP